MHALPHRQTWSIGAVDLSFYLKGLHLVRQFPSHMNKNWHFYETHMFNFKYLVDVAIVLYYVK